VQNNKNRSRGVRSTHLNSNGIKETRNGGVYGGRGSFNAGCTGCGSGSMGIGSRALCRRFLTVSCRFSSITISPLSFLSSYQILSLRERCGGFMNKLHWSIYYGGGGGKQKLHAKTKVSNPGRGGDSSQLLGVVSDLW
jgi:hypothetical protein